MKKNNKGFVLAEAIIVSVFVLGMFTYLAMNVIPLIARYERVTNYDNPQEIYLANTLYVEMLKIETITNIENDIIMKLDDIDSSNLTCIRQTPGEECTGSDDFYKSLGEALKIEKIYTYENNCKGITDKGLQDYCEYYIKRNKNESQNISKAFMIKFSGDKERNSSTSKEDGGSYKNINSKYATIVIK